MKTEYILSRAKAKLLVEYPAFGHIISRMEFIRNDDIQNCISDGKRFEYNDDFLLASTQEELSFALCHAALHTILNHTSRKQKRASYLWQLASDYAISSMLKQSGFTLPEFARYQSRFEGMYAEEIYAILKDETKNEEFSDDEDLESGFNEENKQAQRQSSQHSSSKHDNERYQMEAELEERLEQKFIEQLLQRFEDEIPQPILRHINITPRSRINWKNELRRAVSHHAKSDYALFPPSKKLLYEGIYLPSVRSEELRLAIAVDVSGSVDDTLLEEFFNEVAYILLGVSSYVIELIVADEKIRHHTTLRKGDAFPNSFQGGCGTDFRVVFEYIKKQRIDPKLLLFFTDMQGTYPQKKPAYEVVWVTKQTSKPPFGRVIELY